MKKLKQLICRSSACWDRVARNRKKVTKSTHEP